MVVLRIMLFLVFVTSNVLSDLHITDEEYKLLPPIFHIDPYDKCLQEKKKFCRISLKLTPIDSKYPSKTWKLIEETNESKQHYNHDELYYAVCADDYVKDVKDGNITIYLNAISEYYTNKYENIGIRATVVKMDCDSLVYNTGIFDTSLLCIITSYLLLIAFATVYDVKTYQYKEGNKYILLFSLRHNLIKLKSTYQNNNFQKLKCIQGLRFYTTLLIIFCHTFCSFAGGYIVDTKYLEDFPENYFRHGLRNLFVFLVQTFFLISSWLLSYHTFKIYEENEKVNAFKYACLTFCNRYLRIIPPILLMIFLSRSVWIYGFFHGPVKYIYSDREFQRCQKNWWINLLFLNNHFKQHDMCYFISWYLAADTQLYALCLLLLILMNKFKHGIKIAITICIFVGIAIPSVVSYLYNLDIIYRINPENSKNNMFRSFEFSATYSSTYSNMGTYMLGLAFGYVYFKLENKTLFTNNHRTSLWWTLFIGLPITVIVVSYHDYERVSSAILTGILRPMYALGIGIGIFGMSQQTGGFVKKFFEWKPAIFLGNVTYSTYVVQFGIVFYRTALTSKPLHVSDFILFTSFIQDAVLSFICGFFVHLLLEMPASQIQKIFMPKFKLQKKEI